MSAFANLSEYVNRLTGGNNGNPQRHPMLRTASQGGTLVAGVANRFYSRWRFDGQPSGATASPSTAATCTRTTEGALGQANAGTGRELFLTGIGAFNENSAGFWILADRLCHQGGLDGTVTTAQTTNLPTAALPRYTDGIGVMAALEVYTQVGATATTVTVSYTDEDNNSGQTSPNTPFGGTGLRDVGNFIPIPLAAGDRGIRAVASVTLAATTGTAGDFGVTLFRPLAFVTAPMIGVVDLFAMVPSLPKIVDDACLFWIEVQSQVHSVSSGRTLLGAEFVER